MFQHRSSWVYCSFACIFILAMTIWPTPAKARSVEKQLQAIEKLLAAPPHRLAANDGEGDDQFGWSVAINSNTAVVSAYQNDVNENKDQGSVYVFTHIPGEEGQDSWEFVTQLFADGGEQGDHFGSDVAISGDTIIVGAYLDDVGGNESQGSAYIFSRNQGGENQWGLVQQIVAEDGAAGDSFGFSVGISGDIAIVSAYGNTDPNSAYIFSRNQGGTDNWGQVQQLTPGGGIGEVVTFGYSVAISGDVAVVGTQSTIGTNAYQGSAYVYTSQGGNWSFAKQLIAEDGQAYDLFGQSVTVSGDVAVIGAPSHSARGAAYVFARNQDGADQWGFVRQLAPSLNINAAFGHSVALDGDMLAVGADWGGYANQGTVYVYERHRDGADRWGFVKELLAPDGEPSDSFGISVGVSGDLAIAGAVLDDNQIGSAHIFRGINIAEYKIHLPLAVR